MCNSIFHLSTSANEKNNLRAVQGISSTGIGFYNAEELFSVLNIPFMSAAKYKKCNELICEAWESTAKRLMNEAAKEEAEYALKNGTVDKDGVPLISVVADGCWSKRSYKTNYNALSGAAAIVGHQFGKVLFLSVKNKFCSICNNSSTPVPHTCFKNFNGTSTSMESESILEGFKSSESMYGIRYATLIADGDSSTYKKILEARPYKSLTVEKIECRNHLLRNFSNKLKSLTTDTRFPLKFRKEITKNILRLRTAITKAIEYRKESTDNLGLATQLLKKDIDNSIRHVFGDHKDCASYFCKQDLSETNLYNDLKKVPELLTRLNCIISSISNHSRSLIKNLDSNIVEQINSM